jgi:predicted O-linked N-acetylglucosamine transferase (SPINDLY family)
MPVNLKKQGDFLQNQGKLSEAIACYQAAIQQKPDYAEVFNNMGMAFKGQNRLDEALVCYQKALEINPDYATACNNLANVFMEKGKLNDAESFYQKALEARPDFPEAYNNLGNVLKEQGRLDEAIRNYHNALSVRPNYPEAYNNLGNAYQEKNALADAIRVYQQALRFDQNNYKTYSNLGNAYQKDGQLHQALSCYRKALELQPDFAEAYNNAGNLLLEIGEIHQALENYKRALQLYPDYAVAHSNLLLSMNYQPLLDSHTYYRQTQIWWQQHGKSPATPVNPSPGRNSNRPLKIGYVSPDFRQHSVSYFFLPLLRAHNHRKVEVCCYADVRAPDYVTAEIKRLCDHWRPTMGLSDEAVATCVRDDAIDILVDLAGHTAGNRLLVFAYKPAPVQVTWLGYPNATGMPVMDYRLTDDIADPRDPGEDYHSETLIRLPQGFLCYEPPNAAPNVSPLPASNTGHITFGSFNNLPKLNERVIALWAQILLEVPESCLMLKCKQLVDESTRRRFLDLFSQKGIGSERITLLSRVDTIAGHLAMYHQVDIGLDPFPYNGTTTSCEALWMGVPVVALRGNRHSSRVGASLLTRLGLTELIAESEVQYIRIAAELASDTDRLDKLRVGMRQRMKASMLLDNTSFALNMENAFRSMWTAWSKKNTATPERHTP